MFKTIGTPNIAGSFILNNPGITVIGAKVFSCLLAFFLCAKYPNARTKPMVAPPPPMNTKLSINTLVKIFGRVSPV
ncbi:Uncharacterised protein [Streptococcus pneumoniae]|nr:Uncharacterised protein [Streptococcus pneumoniae]CGF64673.1 Uncharacterised protein [Streptococcus pneumoniae]CIV76610.1 Uncharacterised protein [Streptococcus pneumoniae]CIW04760.1 Uncharacterised protein [Streptococcus pneumoniae]CRF30617.1 Uncharacterised protein [Streptococcus pneumoniae]